MDYIMGQAALWVGAGIAFLAVAYAIWRFARLMLWGV